MNHTQWEPVNAVFTQCHKTFPIYPIFTMWINLVDIINKTKYHPISVNFYTLIATYYSCVSMSRYLASRGPPYGFVGKH